jgi:predicted nuclease of predicted toxin-antitoxin system
MRFLLDENVNNRIIKGLRRELQDVDILRAQDSEIFHAPDPLVLAFAAQEGRIS